MDTRIILFITLVALGSAQDPTEPWFDCDSFRPLDHLSFEEQHSPPPFAIWTNDSFVQRGGALQVTLKRMHTVIPLKSFVVQARLIGSHSPLGLFEVPETAQSFAKGHFCDGGSDGSNTVTSKNFEQKTQDIVVIWRAPADLAGSIEFLGSFVTNEDQIWLNVNSIEVDLKVVDGDTAPSNTNKPSPGVFSNGDPHQALKEAELAARYNDKQMHEIQEEDKYSEGDWQRQEEQQRRAHVEAMRREEEDYERQMAKENRERMERIHKEMMDKEEHDRLAWENEHKGETMQNDDNIISLEGDDIEPVNAKATTSGAAMMTSGVLALLFTIAVLLRRN